MVDQGTDATAFSVDIDVELEAPVTVVAVPALQRSTSDDAQQPEAQEATTSADNGPDGPDNRLLGVRDPRRIVDLEVAANHQMRAQPLGLDGGSRDLSTEVEHLPPLTLSIDLPSDYPSHTAPRFSLSSCWLDARSLSGLVQQLDSLWTDECAGSTCVFRWAEWLRHESMSFLGIEQRLELCAGHGVDGAAGKLEPCDSRAISECSIPEHDFAELMRHNWEMQEAKRCAEVVVCPICLEEQTGASCVRGMGGACDHVSCSKCLVVMVLASGGGGDVDDCKCARPDCRAPMPADLIARLCPRSMYTRWESRKKEKLLLAIPGLCYCPRCDPASADFKARNGRAKLTLCKFFAQGSCVKGGDCRFAHGEAELAPVPKAVPCLPVSDGSGDDSLCICPECAYSFCAACHDAYHPGVLCTSSDSRLEYLQTRERLLREQGGDSLSSGVQDRLLAARSKLEELRSIEAIRKMSKPCPQCGMAISKTEGCNHMQCRFCASHFCWTCLAVITSSNPYDHFTAEGCRVFPDATPGNGNANHQEQAPLHITAAQRREDRLARQQLRLALREAENEVGVVTRRCPFCGGRCFKAADNSNHHRCENCAGAFCFLCLADLRRGMRGHFGPAHPQHSY